MNILDPTFYRTLFYDFHQWIPRAYNNYIFEEWILDQACIICQGFCDSIAFKKNEIVTTGTPIFIAFVIKEKEV